ncbi:DUF835 domain-containing protein [Thermococcus sp. 21S9]|uniref:DUF835 domain-containing protein n=1 Tax=Thermococcus sp. 21S9 TaxID=1638223 RepID=UPI00143B9500|nr:DUF835 domain-containing protein [Thermococcus sp. 21S9]NJE53727.1 DUF835 domain-containing protein [Thermococcus sp. 21S9]
MGARELAGEFQTIKLLAEIIAFATLTSAFVVAYSLRDVLAGYVDKRTLRGVFLGVFIFWLGYLENVFNELYKTELTKVLDDVLVAIGMTIIVITGFQMKREIRAVKPKVVTKGPTFLEPGAYITYNVSPSVILPLLQGRQLLAITRHPQPYEEHGIPYIWISNVPSENTVRPTGLAQLLHKVLSNVDDNTFIIVDGLEYLILNNGFEPVMKFLMNLKDNLLTRNAGMVVIVDPKTLDGRQMNMLMREFERLPLQKP